MSDPFAELMNDIPRGRMHIVLSHDPGGQSDFGASAISTAYGDLPKEITHAPITNTVIDRFPLKTSHHDQVEKNLERLAKLRAKYAEATLYCVIDATGLGGPVAEIYERSGKVGRRAGVDFRAVSLTNGGDGGQKSLWRWTAPKKDVIQSARLALALQPIPALTLIPDNRSPHSATLKTELQNYSYKVSASGHVGSEAARDSIHDDLVIALALGVWRLQRRPRPRDYGQLVRFLNVNTGEFS